MHRRAVLKGMGYSLFLPFLDVMLPKNARADAFGPPRFVSMFLNLGTYGNGYDPTKAGAARYPKTKPWEPGGGGIWMPKATGPFGATPLPPVLAPLEAHKGKVAIVSGLGTYCDNPFGEGNNHSAATTNWSTSAWRTKAQAIADNILPGGGKTKKNDLPPDSIDQYIANASGISAGSTLVLSGQAGDYGEPGQGGHGGAISYNSRLAAGGSTVLPRNTDPLKAFNTLFANCKDGAPVDNSGKKSVLDYVKGSIESTQTKLGGQDKARLDSYLTNIRDLEKRLTAVTACPTAPTASPAKTGGPLDNVSLLNMMVDVIALAVASGAMPIASLMTSREADACSYASAGVSFLSTFVGVNGQKVNYRSSGLNTHNDVSHQMRSSLTAIEEHIAYTQMNFHFVKRLVQTLDAMPLEPNGLTPLDNTIVLAGACHANSGDHSTHNLMTILAGGKRYGMVQGRHVAFPQKTDIGDFYFTMAKAMGVTATSFNGRNQNLAGVFT